MRKPWAVVILALMMSGGALAQKPPLLAEKDVAALANEVSGETANRNLEGLARFHRQRGSNGYHKAAELVAERLRAYGLSDVTILQFPADGKIYYGTQRSRPAWDAESASLREIIGSERVPCGHKTTSGLIVDCLHFRMRMIANINAEPVVLAEDSQVADVTAELVDVGEGIAESDYMGKNVKGKLVLVSSQPGAVQDLAVGKFGAVGIVSYAQNQKTAWWGENQDAVRWGHLDTFSKNKTFAFMVSLKTAHGFQGRLKEGEKIKLHAVVKAGQHPGNYEVVTATIPGSDPKLKEEEIVFSCHLDHQQPGANDNASGCATILEVARTLQKSFNDGRLAHPARTIRFVFPPEIEGTLTLLNAKPDLTRRIKAVVHMDMVGGGLETKAVFHVTRGPMSLPSFVQDVAWAFAEFVNEQSYQYAATGKAAYPLLSPEGGKEPLRAEFSSYTMGSDHDVYQDSSFGIPAIYLNDWPDRFIHTNLDTPANIDPTKLKRVAFIGAASGYFLANLSAQTCTEISPQISMQQTIEMNEAVRRANQLPSGEVETALRLWTLQSSEKQLSLDKFLGQNLVAAAEAPGVETPTKSMDTVLGPETLASGDGLLKFARNPSLKGPMEVFGSNYLEDERAKRGLPTKPKLLDYTGLWGSGEEYGYEVLNFTDGKRNAQQIRDAVSAEYGPVPLEMVVEYLKALEAAGVVEQAK